MRFEITRFEITKFNALHVRTDGEAGPRTGRPVSRRGIGFVGVLVILVMLTLAAGAIYATTVGGGGTATGTAAADLFPARQGSFDISIPASGELVARRQVEVTNALESRAVISYIVDEGTYVQKGDVLFRLNDEEIRERIRTAEDDVVSATNQLEAALAEMEIRQNAHKSQLAQANLTIKLADLAYKAWEKGEVVSRRKSLALAVETAEKNYERLVERYEASQRLLEQSFISPDEFKQDEISMIQARATLEQARLDTEVYEAYTFEQQRETKLSDCQQARDELEREKKKIEAEVRRLESDVESKQRNLENKQERLENLERQLGDCAVLAPSSGLVVYYSSLDRDRRGGNDPPEIGTQLSRNETVIVLPDTSEMIAEVKVNEAISGDIEPGQKASIISDARPEEPMMAEVLGVGVLAEGGSWRDPNRRDYTVRLLIRGGNEMGLKPSMRCKATIYVDRVEDATHVPIQAVFRKGPVAYVYVPEDGGYAQRPVELGRASELYVEVLAGLSADEQVLLRRPDPREVVSEIGSGEGEGGGASAVADGRPPRGERPESEGEGEGETAAADGDVAAG